MHSIHIQKSISVAMFDVGQISLNNFTKEFSFQLKTIYIGPIVKYILALSDLQESFFNFRDYFSFCEKR